MATKKAIDKMLASNRALETASHHAAEIKTATNVAAWHTRDSQVCRV